MTLFLILRIVTMWNVCYSFSIKRFIKENVASAPLFDYNYYQMWHDTSVNQQYICLKYMCWPVCAHVYTCTCACTHTHTQTHTFYNIIQNPNIACMCWTGTLIWFRLIKNACDQSNIPRPHFHTSIILFLHELYIEIHTSCSYLYPACECDVISK